MDSVNWIFIAIGVWLALIAFFFEVLQYFNRRRRPKSVILKRSILIGTVPSVILYFLGVAFWVKSDEELFRESYVRFTQNNQISDTTSVVPRSIPLPPEIIKSLEMLDIAKRAGISFQPETYYQKGVLRYNSEDFEDAKKEFEIAVNLDSNMTKAHYGLGNALLNLGKFEQAIISYNVALKISRQNHDIYFEACTLNSLGLAYRNLNRTNEASISHNMALEKFKQINYKTGIARTINNIGIVNFSKGNNESALDYFTLALDLHRKDGNKMGEVRALTNMGLYYTRVKNFTKALEIYETAAKLAHDNEYFQGEAKAYLNTGAIYFRKKEFENALVYGGKALAISEKHDFVFVRARALTNIGLAYQHLKDHDKAIQNFLRALSLPLSEGSYGFITKPLRSRESEDEINVQNYRINILLTIGYSYSAKGMLDSAIVYTNEIIKLDSTFAPAYANLAAFNTNLKNYDEAIIFLEKSLKFDSTHATAYYNLACIHSLQNNTDRAIQILLKGRKYFSDDLVTHSKTDSDLNNIRQDPRFEKVMYGKAP